MWESKKKKKYYHILTFTRVLNGALLSNCSRFPIMGRPGGPGGKQNCFWVFRLNSQSKTTRSPAEISVTENSMMPTKEVCLHGHQRAHLIVADKQLRLLQLRRCLAGGQRFASFPVDPGMQLGSQFWFRCLISFNLAASVLSPTTNQTASKYTEVPENTMVAKSKKKFRTFVIMQRTWSRLKSLNPFTQSISQVGRIYNL